MALELPQLVTPAASQRIALRGTRLSVTLAGHAQKATFEQTFTNLETVAIEATYTFPLPAEAAVCGFEVVTGDRVLTGQVEEAEEALQRYDEAISAGHGAYLLEQHRPDIFTVNVGNLKPGQAATVKVTYTAPLGFQEHRLRLAYPTTIAPRYVTASGQADPVQAEMDGEVVNPPHVLCVPYGLTLAMEVRLGRAVRAITSPTHSIRCEMQAPDGATASLAAGVTEMDRDLVVEVDMAADAGPVAQAGAGPDGKDTFLAVAFLPECDPPQAAPPVPQSIAFLLDCSGSMQGESIDQAKRALELCLRSLSLGDRFSIGRFGSRFEFIAPADLEYGEASLDQALAYLGRARADLGGTELLGALEAVLAQPPPAGGGLRTVVLLTDGQVSNEAAVIRLAESRRATHRIFTFGIGSACSHHLVQGLAEASRGAAEFVSGDERIEEKVLRTFSRIGSPLATDVRIDWGAPRALPAPATLPPLFDGEPLTAYACIEGDAPASVTLSCRLGGTPREWHVPVTRVADAGLIGLTWVRARLRDLEAALPEDERYGRRRSVPQERRDLQQVVALSKRFGVLCSRTCFVAVEHRSPAERNEGRPELRRTPLQLARGWHGIDAGPAPAAPPSRMLGMSRAGMLLGEQGPRYQRCAPGLLRMRSLRPPSAAEPTMLSAGLMALSSSEPCCAAPRQSAKSTAGRAGGALPDGMALLAAQTAVGWFGWKPDFDAMLAAAPGGGGDLRPRLAQAFSLDGRPNREALMGTLLVLWLLQYGYPDVWKLGQRGVQKALRVVAAELGSDPHAVQQRLDALAPA